MTQQHITEPLIDASVGRGLHTCNPLEEKLSAMSDAILKEEWIRFEILFEEVKDFKPSQKRLNSWGRGEMKSIVSRNVSFPEVEALREKLISRKFDDRELEEGYQEGLKILQSFQR